ncbi:response regulator [Treponema peruense]|uniref:Response regulator transcription factor n=1 Tax=Treponema peruense TaxID=2787628 RepID=A0A7T3RCA6_9SPIR|nr:response regulator transcription factor [Treponema peruense]QQA00496.1 response regulator transcription factor [Treponema peruense]
MQFLIVDDEEPIRELVRYNIEKEGYASLSAPDGKTALSLAREKIPDLIILDLMLPDMSGLDICRILKNDRLTQNIPIIMVTARTEDSDIVTGLELGADDYITKPFSPKVLVARIKSVLRRKNTATSQEAPEEIRVHGISIYPKKHEVILDGKELDFSATEFSILEFLARHIGQVFSRQQIINAVKGSSYPVTERSIDVQILSIRRKLGDNAQSERPVIETLRGVGYRMTEEV